MSSTIVTVSKDLESKADLDKLNHESDDSDDDDEENDIDASEDVVDEGEVKNEARREAKRRHLSEMNVIEGEYATLKERLYGVRLGRIDASLKRLKEGRLHRFKQQKRAIEADRKRHLEIEGHRLKLQITNVNHFLEYTQKGAQDDCEERARALKAEMINQLNKEMCQAERDKKSMDVPFSPGTDPFQHRFSPGGGRGSMSSHGSPPYSSQKRDRPIYASHIKSVEKHKRRKQVVVVRGPYIVYQLTETEILADLHALSGKASRREHREMIMS